MWEHVLNFGQGAAILLGMLLGFGIVVAALAWLFDKFPRLETWVENTMIAAMCILMIVFIFLIGNHV